MLTTVTVDEKLIDWDIPALYYIKTPDPENYIVVISTGKHHNEMFEGIRVYGSANGLPNTQHFRKDCFKRCPNSMQITITNE